MFAFQIGERLELTVHGLNSRGEGVARHGGLAFFVPGALPGERVVGEVISLKPSYGRALLLEVLEASPGRRDPGCALFGRCGACTLLHLEYAEQLRYKTALVREALHRLGKFPDLPVREILGAADPFHYRNKAQVPVGPGEGGAVAAGFYESRSHRIVDCPSCLLQHPANNRAVQEVKRAAAELGVPPYDEASRTGQLRFILSRTAWSSGEVMVVLVARTRSLHRAADLAARLRERVPGLASLVQNVNGSPGSYALGPENRVLWGSPKLTDRLLGLTFALSPAAFFQVNPPQTEKLYRAALGYAALTGAERVLDLHCGAGTVALCLAGGAREVVGVEVNPSAVEDARENARLNSIANASFICADAAAGVARLAGEGRRFDVIVLDPPRKGCDAVLLEKLPSLRPSRIVYISCNPATLARDLRLLAGKGFTPVEVQPVDLFPHTTHVETVVLMSKIGS